jgi:Zn finger protein HypA/HybF involved in hydrogenase expression
VSSFNRDGEGYQWWCRECFRAYFHARGDLHRRQSNAAKERRRKQAQRLVREHLEAHPCLDCGEPDTSVLEFDHLGDKRGEVSALAAGGLSLAALRKEVEGCDVVCANCHRRRTNRRNGSWRVRPETVEHNSPMWATRARNQAYVRDLLLESRCADCGLADLMVLEFDHIGAKNASISELVRGGYSLARLKAEIEQCEVRCANCHRRRTKRSRGRGAQLKLIDGGVANVGVAADF